MTVDEFHLRDTANGLRLLFERLHQLKTEKPQPTTDGNIYRPQPGPNAPNNTHWHSIEDELLNERRGDDKTNIPGGLTIMVLDAAQYVGTMPTSIRNGKHPTGPELCAYVAFNAQTITDEFPAVEELDELMTHQARWLYNKIGQPPDAERRQTAQSISHHLTHHGHWISPNRIHKWARDGHITTQPLPDGKNGYLLSETIRHIQGEPCTPERS